MFSVYYLSISWNEKWTYGKFRYRNSFTLVDIPIRNVNISFSVFISIPITKDIIEALIPKQFHVDSVTKERKTISPKKPGNPNILDIIEKLKKKNCATVPLNNQKLFWMMIFNLWLPRRQQMKRTDWKHF